MIKIFPYCYFLNIKTKLYTNNNLAGPRMFTAVLRLAWGAVRDGK